MKFSELKAGDVFNKTSPNGETFTIKVLEASSTEGVGFAQEIKKEGKALSNGKTVPFGHNAEVDGAVEQPDITYLKGKVFTKFFPETPDGKVIWKQMCEQTPGGERGVASVWNAHLPIALRQIRKAGYVVRKAKPVKMTNDELLDALGLL